MLKGIIAMAIKGRLRLLVLFVLSCTAFAVFAQALGDAPIAAFWKHGYVYTRGLYLGPNGYPIWAEYNKDNGKLIHAIAEAMDSGDQLYGSATVISGDAYRAELQAYQDLIAQHPGQTAAFKRSQYENQPGAAYLYPSTASVVVWSSVNGSFASLALQSSIDLTSPDSSVNAQTASVLIDKNGKVLKASANDIGYRSSFFIPKEGESEQIPRLGNINANAADELRSYRKLHPEEIPLGPVAGAAMDPGAFTGGAITEASGKYFMPYFGPPCPGFFVQYDTPVTATVPFRDFNPRNRSGVGFWPTFIVVPDTCNGHGFEQPETNLIGLMAQVTARDIAIAGVDLEQRLDLLINVLILTSDGIVRNPAGSSFTPTQDVARGATQYTSTASDNTARLPTNLDVNGDHIADCAAWTDASHTKVNVWFKPAACPPLPTTDQEGNTIAPPPPDFVRAPDTQNDPNHQGLLSSLSTDDLKNTDIYVFRASTGDLLAKRTGLLDQEKQIKADVADFYYRIITRSFKIPRPGGSSTQEDVLWSITSVPQLEEPELTNPLRPGEMIQIIAINRATGYMGTQTVPAKGPNTWLGYIALPKLVLAPPHLKVWAERDYTVKSGFEKGSQQHYLIGNEGSALKSDTMIRVYTEWTDDQGMPLPKGLEGEGFTGRLAMMTSPGHLQESNIGQVAHFPINPGRHTQLIQLSQDTSPLTNFYVQVVGDPTEQQYSFEPSGAGAGPLQFRPQHYVPFQVPLLNETKTNSDRLANRFAPATYYWPYRPELQFSVFSLDSVVVRMLAPTVEVGAPPVAQFFDLMSSTLAACDVGDILRNAPLVELFYHLRSPAYQGGQSLQPIEPFGPERRLIFALGGEETTSPLTYNTLGGWDFKDPEHLNKLEPTDISAMQLLQNSDSVNVLWAYSFPNTSCNEELTEGDSCNVGTGSNSQHEQDYVAPNGSLLRFERFYKSFAPSDAREAMGSRWSTNYSRHITSLTGLDTPSVQMWREAGQILSFRKSGGTWTTAPNSPGLLSDRAGGGWIYLVDNSIETYDAGGRLVSESDLRGHAIQLTYNEMTGLLQTITDEGGRTLQISYDAGQRVMEVRDPASQSYRYAYSNADLVSITYPDNTIRQYRYEQPDVPHALTGLIDENGKRFASWTYASNGRILKSEHADGVGKITLVYNNDDSTTVIDALGGKRVYQTKTFFGKTAPIQVSGERCASCRGKAAETEYDENGFVAMQRDFNGNKTLYTHNARGLEIRRIEAADTAQQRVITTLWHPAFRLPIRIDEDGRRSSFEYDSAGNKTSETVLDIKSGQKRTTKFSYTAFNKLERIDGPRTDTQDITRFFYDSQRNLVRIENALGQVTLLENYDAHGRPRRIVDSNGIQANYSYDSRQRLIESVISGKTSTYAYDGAGNIRAETLPGGEVLLYEYDNAHRLIGARDAEGNRVAYTINSAGGVLEERIYDPQSVLRKSVSRTFDLLGRVVQIAGNGGQKVEYTYDKEGNRVSEKSSTTSASIITFDALLRPIRTTNPDGRGTSYEYDALDRVISITDPAGVTTAYTYNGFDEILELNSPDSGVVRYQYDGAGNRIASTDARGIVEKRSYDSINRVVNSDYPGSDHDTTYEYDGANYLQSAPYAVGRMTGILSSSEKITYKYGDTGKVVREDRIRGQKSFSTQYGYDESDRLTSLTYPSGNIVHYDRNAIGNITKARLNDRLLVSDVSYLPFGPTQKMTLGNGIVAQQTYDLDYRLKTQQAGNIYQRSMSYDARDLIVTIEDEIDQNRTQHFSYDEMARLTTARGTYGEFTYAYDANGNRIREIHNGQVSNYEYEEGSNRLLHVDGSRSKSYSYNDIGEITSDGARNFSYDIKGRLQSDITGEQDYSADGHLRQKENADTAINFIYSTEGNLISETTETGIQLEYVFLNEMPLAVIATDLQSGTDEISFYLTDHLGTPQKIVDQQQQVVWDADYEPFGLVATRIEDKPSKLRFRGQYQHEGASVYQNWHRDYDPITGRYLEPDPIGLSGGLNPYGYATANPLGVVDPEGLQGISIAPEIIMPAQAVRPIPQSTTIDPAVPIPDFAQPPIKDPFSPRCRHVAKKIENIKKDIAKREQELAQNPQNLPERLPPSITQGLLRLDRRGHKVIIRILERSLRAYEKEYYEDCGGC